MLPHNTGVIYERDLLWVFSFFLLLLSLEPAVLGYNPLLLMTIVIINIFPYLITYYYDFPSSDFCTTYNLSYDLFFFSQVADTYDLV